MSIPDPTDEQLAAIECRDRDIMVEAGAGTGKTSTTIRRYARLIEDGLEPGQILVFTYTEKAANELRERVRKMRSETRAEFSMSSAWIGTFHSICSRILRAHPIAAGVDPAFTVIEKIDATRLRDRAWSKALAEATEDPDLLADVATFYPPSLRMGLENAWEKLRSYGQLDPELPELPVNRADPRDLARELALTARQALETPRIQRGTRDRLTTIIEGIEALPPGAAVTRETVRSLCPKKLPDSVAIVQAAVDDLLGRVCEIEFGDRIYTGLGRLLSAFGAEYSRLKSEANTLDFEDLQLRALDLLKGHPGIAAGYRDQFCEIMVDEFQDTNPLQMDLIGALRGEETTLFTVGDEMQAIYGFRHADIELFRSRRDQLGENVLPLSANFRSTGPIVGAVNEIGRKVNAAVAATRDGGSTGDAAVGVSHRFQDLRNGIDGGRPDGGEVSVWLNEAGSWSELDLGPLSMAPERPKDAGGHDSPPSRPASAGQGEAEALSVAHEIRRAVTEDGFEPEEIVLLFRAKANMWKFKQALKQVGIPAYVVGGAGFWESREGVDLRALLAVLANPLDNDSLLGLLAGPACGISSDALWKLAAARRTDRREQADLGVERDGEENARLPRRPLWTVATNPEKAGVSLSESDRQRLGRTVETIALLRAKGTTIPLGELVEAAVTETGYDLVSLRRDPSGAGLANIRRVSTLAASYEAVHGRDVRGLIGWIDASRDLDTEAAVATEDEHSDTVRLMTIHGAKGLEFDFVCLADMGRRRQTDTESVLWIGRDAAEPGRLTVGLRIPDPDEGEAITLYDWDRLSEQTNLASADEELRLLHVALTRARKRLLMSGTLKLGKEPGISPTSSPIANLVATFGLNSGGPANDESDDPTLPDSIPVPAPETLPQAGFSPAATSITVHRNLASPERARELAGVFPPRAKDQPPGRSSAPPLKRPALGPLPDVPLSYSALSEFERCPARFYARRVLRLDDPDPKRGDDRRRNLDQLNPENRPPDIDHDGTVFGSAVHLLLEKASTNRWIRPRDGQITRVLKDAGLDPEGEAHLRARSMVDGFLESGLGERVRGGPCESEATLLVRSGRVMIRGFIDLLMPETDPPLVIDYKTNRLDGGEPTGKMAAYELQRDLYALGTARMNRVSVVDTAYVFLEAPDRPLEKTYDQALLDEAGERVDRLVGEITGGRYFGGPEAGHHPCGECWACDLLAGRIESATPA